MERQVGIGLIGVGWMGRVHTAAYLAARRHFPGAPRVRLVAAADESEARAREAVDVLGYAQAVTDWREVIADPEVEAVSVTVPNGLHRDVVLAAIAAHKHVWVEKPVGRVPRETEEIAAAVERSGVLHHVGFNFRNVPAIAHARDLIATGALGEPTHFRSHWIGASASRPDSPLSWRFRWDSAGLGVLGDLGSHAIDLSQFLLGPIASVSARTATLVPERPLPTEGGHSSEAGLGELGRVENEDVVWSLVRFANGVLGTLEASRVAVGPDARYVFEVHGTEGAVGWNFERMNELAVHLPLTTGDAGYARIAMGPQHPLFDRFQPAPGITMGYDDLKVIEAARFLESVLDGVQREPGVREALEAARVAAAMHRSAASGVWEDVGDTALASE